MITNGHTTNGSSTPIETQIAAASPYARNLDTMCTLTGYSFHVHPVQSSGAKAKAPYPEFLWKDESTADTVKAWNWWTVPGAKYYPAAAVAVDCGKSGLVVIDPDCKDEKTGLRDWLALVGKHGGLPGSTPIVRTPSGGLHVYFRQRVGAELLGCSRGGLPAGVEVRGVGGYVVGCYSVIEGGAYTLVSGDFKNIPEVPEWLYDLIHGELRAAQPEVAFERLEGDELDRERQKAAKALRFILPSDRETCWLPVGMALASRFGDDGRDLWDEWSKRDPKFDAYDQEKIWNSFAQPGDTRGGRPLVGLGSIFTLAKERGYPDDAKVPPQLRDLFKEIIAAEVSPPPAEKLFPGLQEAPRSAAPAAVVPSEGDEDTPPFPPAPKPTLYLGGDPRLIPPRPWVYGRHYVRTFTGCTVAPGATGKSFLAIAEGLAIATGKPLLGVVPDERCNVWYLNLEDPTAELERRIAAAIIGHGINMDDLRGRFFADSGRKQKLVVASQVGSTAVIHEPVQKDLVRYIIANRIGVMIVDPFLKSHSVSENDNNAVDKVMGMWADVAEDANCAIELIHHTRKLNGNEEPSADDSRGASAVITNVRSCRVVVRMTKDEANGANIDTELRRQYFKLGDGKINMAPFKEKAEWYHLDSVDLGNAQGDRKSDSVGVVKSWAYPSLADEVPANALRRVQGFLATSDYRSDPRASDWIGQAVADAAGWEMTGPGVKDSVKALIKQWLKDGYLKTAKHNDKEGHLKEWIVAGKPATSLAEITK